MNVLKILAVALLLSGCDQVHSLYTPSPDLPIFMDRCSKVGFTPAQCRFQACAGHYQGQEDCSEQAVLHGRKE